MGAQYGSWNRYPSVNDFVLTRETSDLAFGQPNLMIFALPDRILASSPSVAVKIKTRSWIGLHSVKLRRFRWSSGKPAETVELRCCGMRNRFLISIFSLAHHAIHGVSFLWRCAETKQLKSTATSKLSVIWKIVKFCQTPVLAFLAASRGEREREGWLGAAQHNLGNDLPKTIKLMVSMKADVSKPDSSLTFLLYSQNWSNEVGAPRMVVWHVLKMLAWPVVPALSSSVQIFLGTYRGIISHFPSTGGDGALPISLAIKNKFHGAVKDSLWIPLVHFT